MALSLSLPAWEEFTLTTVVMLTWEYPPQLVGGLSRHVHGLARALAKEGKRVHVLTRQMPGLPEHAVEEGVSVTRVRPYFQEPRDFRLWVQHLNFALLEAGVSLLASLPGPVVLHAHDWLVAYAAKGLKNLFRVPLIATIHATEHGRHHGIHDDGQQYINDIEWWLTYEAWRVIVCSGAMRAEVKRLFGLSDDKVLVIPNGIDLPDTPAEAVRPEPTPAGERLLFHVGRLVPEKGAGVLLAALPHLLRRHPVRAVIAGVGPYELELKRQAALLRVQDRVQFVGWLDDVCIQAYLRAADVAVVPSTYEPFGIVALEAMAHGAPLVASDVGGLTEIICHGVNGLKAVPGNSASLAEQIDRLLRDPVLAQQLSQRARQDVLARYTWDQIARSTATVYSDVAEACALSDWTPPAELPWHRLGPTTLRGRYTT